MDNRKLLDLLDKYLAGTLTAEEQKEFTAWYAGPASEQPDLSEEYKDSLFSSIKQEIRSRRKIHTLKKWWVPAAAACLLIALGVWFLRIPRKQNPRPDLASNAHYKTPAPEDSLKRIYNSGRTEKEFVLADGSVVSLAPNSEIAYGANYGKVGRLLYLKGAASFKVAKDPRHIFTVYSRRISTTALGTAFSVASYDSSGSVRVSLYSGKVVVRNSGSEGKPFNDVYLEPGEDFNLNILSSLVRVEKEKGNGHLHFGQVNDTADFLVTGYEASFDQVPLGKVINELENGYHIVIKFRKKDVKDISFSGNIAKSDSLSWVLNRIAVLHNINFTKSANNEFIMQKKNP